MEKFGSMGRFIEGVDGEILEDNELVIYGKNVSMGYANSAYDLARGDDNGGRLCTGDIVMLDEGYLYWKGRKDRYIKINGIRISLDEVDVHLEKEYKNNIFFTVFINERIIINTDNVDDEKVICFISNITGLNKKIFRINYIKSFKRKENGKIDYSAYN